VEDHDASESLGGVGGGSIEDSAIDLSHDLRRVVANVFASAVVLIGAGWSNIEDTMTIGTEGNSGVADIRSFGKSNLEEGNVVDDWG